MRPERLLAQRLVRAAGAQARGELAPPIAAAAAHARAYQAAAEIPDGNEPGSEAQQGAEHPQQQQQWAPRRGLPPADAYGVQVTIKAHNLKFVKLASTAVRDLMLLHFAPKSRAALPPALQQPGQVPWVNLAMPVGDVSLPTRRSHFTVIRGPHVHKTSREQFARTTHKRLISFSTNNLSELTWFLDNLKLYQFVGAELSVRVSSSSYLLPTSSAEQDGAAAPLLAGHMRRFGRLFGGASGSRSASGSGASGSASFEALQQSLQGLQQAVRQGLVQQRAALSDTQAFQHWQQAMGPDGDDSSGTVAATAAQPARAVADAVSQQLEGSPLAAADGSSSGGGAAAAPGGGDAFLAAVDKALLGVKLDVLDRQRLAPFLMAFYRPGQRVPAAEWMHAVLKFGQAMQQQADASQEGAALRGYQQFGDAGRAVLLLLLQRWHSAADGGARQQLGLPDVDRAQQMVRKVAATQQQGDGEGER